MIRFQCTFRVFLKSFILKYFYDVFYEDLTAFRQNLIKFTNSALWKILVLGAFVPTCSDDNTTLLAARTLGPPVLWDPLHVLAVQFYDRSV